jgi:hypothetical protein
VVWKEYWVTAATHPLPIGFGVPFSKIINFGVISNAIITNVTRESHEQKTNKIERCKKNIEKVLSTTAP